MTDEQKWEAFTLWQGGYKHASVHRGPTLKQLGELYGTTGNTVRLNIEKQRTLHAMACIRYEAITRWVLKDEQSWTPEQQHLETNLMRGVCE